MKERVNYTFCIKVKCDQCKNYNKCFKEEVVMKKIKFLVDVPDKYTREEYKKGQVKEFEDKRAEEILAAKQSSGEPYAVLIKEEEVETAVKKTTVRKKK